MRDSLKTMLDMAGAAILAAGLLLGSGWAGSRANGADAASSTEGKPYTAECDGSGSCRVDQQTYTGWRTYNGNCARCHGEGALGSSFAPNLMDRITRNDMDYQRFETVVRKGVSGQIGVMPGWEGNPNVMSNVEALWAYLLARTDGVLPAGRPERISEELPEDAPANWE